MKQTKSQEPSKEGKGPERIPVGQLGEGDFFGAMGSLRKDLGGGGVRGLSGLGVQGVRVFGLAFKG